MVKDEKNSMKNNQTRVAKLLRVYNKRTAAAYAMHRTRASEPAIQIVVQRSWVDTILVEAPFGWQKVWYSNYHIEFSDTCMKH